MIRSLRTVLVATVGLVLVVVLGLAVGASAVDWTQFRAPLAERLSNLLDARVTIDGVLSLKLLPRPAVSVRAVSVSDDDAAVGSFTLSADTLNLSVDPLSLLSGRVEIDRVRLLRSELLLHDAGPPPRSTEADPAAPGRAARPHSERSNDRVDVRRIDVREGRVHWIRPDGSALHLEGINATTTVEADSGRLRTTGNILLGGRGVDFVADLSGPQDAGRALALALRLPQSDALARFEGTVEERAAPIALSGDLRLEASDIGALLGLWLEGIEPTALAPIAGQPLLATANLDWHGTDVALTALSARAGQAQATAGLRLRLDSAPGFSARVNLENVELDEWTSLLAAAGDRSTASDPPDPASPGSARPQAETAFAGTTDWTGQIALAMSRARWRGMPIRELSARGTLRDGELAVDALSAALPGTTRVEASGRLRTVDGRPRFAGSFAAEAADARTLVAAIGLEETVPPGDRTEPLTASGRLEVAPATVRFPQIDVALAGSTFSGAVTYRDRRTTEDAPGRLSLVGRIDRVDVDRFGGAGVVPSGGVPTGAPADAAPAATGPDLAIDVQVGEVTVQRRTMRSVTMKADRTGQSLVIHQAGFADFAGASGSVTGRLSDGPRGLRFQGQFRADVPEPQPLFAALEIKPPFPAGRFGAFSTEGALRGSPEDFAYSGSLNALGGRSRIDARGGVGASGSFLELDADGRFSEMEQLLALVAPEARQALGDAANEPLGLKLSVIGDDTALQINGSAEVFKGRMGFDGSVTDHLSDRPKWKIGFDGRFGDARGPIRLLLPQFNDLLAALGVSERLKDVGKVDVTGRSDTGFGAADVAEAELRLLGSELKVKRRRSVRAPDEKMDASIDADIPRLDRWVEAFGADTGGIEAAAKLKRLLVRVEAKGPTDRLALIAEARLPAFSDGLVKFEGNVDAADAEPEFDLEMTADIAEALPVLQLVMPSYRPALRNFGELSLFSRFSGTPKRVNLEGVVARIGPLGLRGNVGIDLSRARPRLSADVTSPDELLLDMILPSNAGSATLGGRATRPQAQTAGVAGRGSMRTQMGRAAPTGAPWAGSTIDLSALKRLDAEIAFAAPSVRFHELDLQFQEPKLQARLQSGRLEVENLSVQFLDGKLDVAATLDASGEAPRVEVNVDGDRLDLGSAAAMVGFYELPIVYDGYRLGSARLVGGRARLSGRFATAGRTDRDWIGGLEANVELDGRDVALAGIDLGGLTRGLAQRCRYVDPPTVVREYLFGGDTRFATLKGGIRIDKGGRLGFRDLALQGPEGSIALESDIRLMDWRVETLQMRIKLAEPADAPKFGIDFRGPFGQLESEAKVTRLLNHLGQSSPRCGAP